MDNKAIRLKIFFENLNKVERVVDVAFDSTLEHLHLTILAAFEFSAGEMASFWLCDPQDWIREQEVPMIRIQEEGSDEESACMADVEVIAAINGERRYLIYEYDMLLMWVLRIEFIEMVDQIESMEYPVLVSDQGKIPNVDEARTKLLEDSSENDDEDAFKDGGGYDDYDEDFSGGHIEEY